MTIPHKDNRRWQSLRLIIPTAVLTFVLTGLGAYLLSDTIFRDIPEAGISTSERKIVYWRAPMNPEEIYDKPGKSAMGMDLVPVYEDEMESGGGVDPLDRKIAYWRAPMNPEEVYDKPGKSAMGMDLVPVYEDELISGVEVMVDPVTQQNMGLRTAAVKMMPLVRNIRTYGHVTAAETRTVRMSAKTAGWVETLYVDFTGKYVEEGEPLMAVYSPELLAAQEEYLAAFRSLKGRSGSAGMALLPSSRQRLRYFDVAESEIDVLESTGAAKKALLIRSPASGYVIERNIESGGYFSVGTTLFRIADLTQVWVEAHIYEYELPWVKEGQQVIMRLPYHPGREFYGNVAYVYPYLAPKTRDVVVRLEFDNKDLVLKPDMFADVLINTTSGAKGLTIPAEAVIHSGERTLVFVPRAGGKFAPRDVTLGPKLDGGRVQVLAGLASGETVVTSGQFLLDSESKLKEAVQKMLEAKQAKVKSAVETETEKFFEELESEQEDFFKELE